MEKELQIEIQKELVNELAARTKIERIKQDDVRTTTKPNNNAGTTTSTAVKRKSGGNIATTKATTKSTPNPQQQSNISTSNDKIKTSSKGRKSHKAPTGKKKEKLYCVCRTPYDDSK